MPTPAALLPSPGLPGRALALLSGAAVASAAAFVIAPRLLANRPGVSFADQRALVGALQSAFVEFWRSGESDQPPHLQGLVDYWFRYHVVKAVTATLLLIVLVTLGIMLWKAFLRAGDLRAGTRIALASGGVLVTVLALFSLALVMANVQGALAPFSSLLSLLGTETPHGVLAGSLDQVRQQLSHYPAGSRPATSAVGAMVSDFGWYHAVMAVIAAILAVVFVVLSTMLWMTWTRTSRSERRTRRVLGSFGVLSTVLSVAVVLLAIGNVSVAVDPAPALLAFYQGGW